MFAFNLPSLKGYYSDSLISFLQTAFQQGTTRSAFSLFDSFTFVESDKQHVTEGIDVYIFQVLNSNPKSLAGATFRRHVQAISLFFFFFF